MTDRNIKSVTTRFKDGVVRTIKFDPAVSYEEASSTVSKIEEDWDEIQARARGRRDDRTGMI